MKINPRCFPVIILTLFVLFVLLGLVLGFRPERGEGRHGDFHPAPYSAQLVSEVYC